jgi:4-amino-4-deoxy-L-arabinose transferase-like glycosyltransferase
LTRTENYSVALGLVLVAGLFAAPLFIGLGEADLENDEAGYSFAVDRILEAGDWLAPKASNPSVDAPFLEKPPLKTWIVAAGIRSGLLPHDAFGLRFWDALFGGIVFVYVFFLARRQSNVAGGVAAALVLFVHLPILVLHGFRTNNMEAALTLSYTGGVFHFLRWSDGGSRRHAVAAALYFVLGFMTKFVAVAFLPVIALVVTAVNPAVRAAAWRDRRLWLTSAAVGAALIVPWFVYAHVRFGALLWGTMFGTHIYQRFTAFVDPAHVHPWSFYFVQICTWLAASGTLMAAIGGALLLIVRAARGDRDPLTMVVWFALPVGAMSLATSKLHHYVYPFLPPIAVAAGVAYAWALQLAESWAATLLGRARVPDVRSPALRTVCRAIAMAAFAIALLTVMHGPIWIDAGGRTLFKNGGLLRPWLVLVLFGVLGGWTTLVVRGATALLVLALLPLPAYRGIVPQLAHDPHPMRDVSECVAVLQRSGRVDQGLAVVAGDEELIHPPYYYFRRIGPWRRVPPHDLDAAARLFQHGQPILISAKRYDELIQRGLIEDESLPSTPVGPQLRLELPGAYGSCAAGAETAVR